MAPPTNTKSCEYVTLRGKKDFACVLKLRIFRWRDYSGLSESSQCYHKCPYKWKRKGSMSKSEKEM